METIVRAARFNVGIQGVQGERGKVDRAMTKEQLKIMQQENAKKCIALQAVGTDESLKQLWDAESHQYFLWDLDLYLFGYEFQRELIGHRFLDFGEDLFRSKYPPCTSAA